MRLVQKGALAVKSLTSDAVRYPSSKFPSNPADNPVRQFQKKGDYSQAIRDLVAVFPDTIKDFSTLTGVSYFQIIKSPKSDYVKILNGICYFQILQTPSGDYFNIL